MCKRALTIFLLFSSISFCSVEAYTVIFKNGKLMKGTLVAETEDLISFKDEKGIQFSLKKSLLDLEKMKEANPATPNDSVTAPLSPEKEMVPAQKGKGRVYTAEDMARLKEKYGDLNAGEPIGGYGEESGAGGPQQYLNHLQDAANSAGETLQGLSRMRHEIDTIWKTSGLRKKDPYQWIQEFMGRDASKKIVNYAASQLAISASARKQLADPPEGYEKAYEEFTSAVDALAEYSNLFQQYLTVDVGDEGRSQFSAIENKVKDLLQQISSLPPPKAAPAKQESRLSI